METDRVGVMGLTNPQNAVLEISRTNVATIDEYAASIGKDASNINECFEMLANLIKQDGRPKDGPPPQ